MKIMYLKKQKGQIILILILVMTVALGVGLSIIQRSLSDISSAAKVEQSSRAFSAAEAGIERALQQQAQANIIVSEGDLNNASAAVDIKPNLPNSGQALEYPPVSKEEIAHVWLADLDANPQKFYGGSALDVFWGAPNLIASTQSDNWPALALTIVYADNNIYKSQKFYFDPNEARADTNGFKKVSQMPFSSCSASNPHIINTSSSDSITAQDRNFYCQVRISGVNPSSILLRARILYSSTSHPLAVAPRGGLSLPQQATIYKSTGTFGNSQRTVQLFKLDKVVPFYFDYAIFSAGDITK